MFLAIFLSIMTLLTLVSGILVFALGGKINHKFSNKLMVLRVVFQFLAIISVVFLFIILSK